MAPRNTTTSKRTKRAATKKKRTAQKHPGPKPTTVLLVRPGQTPPTGQVLPGRAAGLHLADSGHEQAQIAADRIAELKNVAAVYSSPLERAKETAAPISKARGLRTRTNRGLIECDFGDWTGRQLTDLMKLPEWQTVQRAPSTFRFPNGESFTEMQTRMVDAIAALCAEHRGETIVCVSHADTIKAAVAQAAGTHLDLFQRTVISPASITAVTYTAGGPIVLAVNSTGRSLTELAPS